MITKTIVVTILSAVSVTLASDSHARALEKVEIERMFREQYELALDLRVFDRLKNIKGSIYEGIDSQRVLTGLGNTFRNVDMVLSDEFIYFVYDADSTIQICYRGKVGEKLRQCQRTLVLFRGLNGNENQFTLARFSPDQFNERFMGNLVPDRHKLASLGLMEGFSRIVFQRRNDFFLRADGKPFTDVSIFADVRRNIYPNEFRTGEGFFNVGDIVKVSDNGTTGKIVGAFRTIRNGEDPRIVDTFTYALMDITSHKLIDELYGNLDLELLKSYEETQDYKDAAVKVVQQWKPMVEDYVNYVIQEELSSLEQIRQGEERFRNWEEQQAAYQQLKKQRYYVTTKLECRDARNQTVDWAVPPDWAEMILMEDFLEIDYTRGGKVTAETYAKIIKLVKENGLYRYYSSSSKGLGCNLGPCAVRVASSDKKPGADRIKLIIDPIWTNFCRGAQQETAQQILYIEKRPWPYSYDPK